MNNAEILQKKLNALNKIINKCQVLHNTPVSKCDVQEVDDTVKEGYKLAYDLIQDATKTKNIEFIKHVYRISDKLLPDNSVQDSVFLDWMKNKYKQEFCHNLVFLTAEYCRTILFPQVKVMKQTLAQSNYEVQKTDLKNRLNTIYDGFMFQFYVYGQKLVK